MTCRCSSEAGARRSRRRGSWSPRCRNGSCEGRDVAVGLSARTWPATHSPATPRSPRTAMTLALSKPAFQPEQGRGSRGQGHAGAQPLSPGGGHQGRRRGAGAGEAQRDCALRARRGRLRSTANPRVGAGARDLAGGSAAASGHRDRAPRRAQAREAEEARRGCRRRSRSCVSAPEPASRADQRCRPDTRACRRCSRPSSSYRQNSGTTAGLGRRSESGVALEPLPHRRGRRGRSNGSGLGALRRGSSTFLSSARSVGGRLRRLAEIDRPRCRAPMRASSTRPRKRLGPRSTRSSPGHAPVGRSSRISSNEPG